MNGTRAMRRVAVFCGSSLGNSPGFVMSAREVGTLLGRAGLGLVYGGACCGLMGAIADAALAAGAEVIGVLPRALRDRELAHPNLTDLRVVDSMHERKALMADLADGFVALPGGFGTLDEFCEVLTWAQLGIHTKPCGLLNVAGYFDGFLAQTDAAVRGGLMRPEHRALILDEVDAGTLLRRMQAFEPVIKPKWIAPSER